MPHRRAAFTLIELLIVIAIVAILCALTLPGIQRVRESAARLSCQNNVKQLTLAVVNYETNMGYYPHGGTAGWQMPTYIAGKPTVGPAQRAGWAFQILPYLEAENLWRAGLPTVLGDAPKSFFCPTRSSGLRVIQNTPTPIGSNPVAMIDYAAADLRVGSEAIPPVGIITYGQNGRRRGEVRDGLANTFLLGDKRIWLNYLDAGWSAPNDDQGYAVSWDMDTLRSTLLVPMLDSKDPVDLYRFGSSHPAGINAGYLDGSARLLAYSVDKEVFRRLGNIADGLPVDPTSPAVPRTSLVAPGGRGGK